MNFYITDIQNYVTLRLIGLFNNQQSNQNQRNNVLCLLSHIWVLTAEPVNWQVSDTIYIFTVAKIEKAWCKCILKGFISSKLVRNDALNVDVLCLFRWHHILRWRDAISTRDVRRTAAALSRRFLVIHSLKWHSAPYSRCKLRLNPILQTLNTIYQMMSLFFSGLRHVINIVWPHVT